MRQSHIRAHGIAACLTLLTTGCGSDPPRPQAASISISIDDDPSTLAEITAPIALASLVWVPTPVWQKVQADAIGGRTLTLTSPATTYPRAEVRLYLDAGRIALGVFPPITADMKPDVARLASQPIESLVGVTSVRITTRRRELPFLFVEVDGRLVVLGTDQLEGLPVVRAGPRGSEGWSLLDVIARVDPRRKWRTIRVIGEDASIEIDTRAESIYVIKANKHGHYVFRVWEHGGKTPTRELRKLTKIALD